MTIEETENLLAALGNRNMFIACGFQNFTIEQRDKFIQELTDEVNKQVELDKQGFDINSVYCSKGEVEPCNCSMH